MKSALRTSLLAACVLVGLSVSAPARADDMLRTAQTRLADLGYYSGPYDGVRGPATHAAIKDFQKQNGLPVTGQLNAATYDLLASMDYRQRQGVGAGRSGNGSGPDMAAIDTTQWHYVATRRIPVRYGALDINEDAKGEIHRYTITLNGRPFLRADNQPGALQVSEVFHLNNEDAIIMTAYRGEDACQYKNYLIILHANGKSASSREFASCAQSSSARMADNALFVSFPATMNRDGFSAWDVWRYENAKLERM